MSVLYVYLCLACLSLLLLGLIFSRAKSHSIRNRRVLLTGAGRGLGKALALRLAREGCQLTLWDIKAPLLDELEQELKPFGNKVRTECVDVGDENAVKNAIAACGEVDIVINNAGVVRGRHFTQLNLGEMRRTVDVNAFGPICILKQLVPAFISRKSGHIVTISSVMAQFYAAGLTDYCMSKAALAAFHNCLRLELRRLALPDIHTTLILPYTIDTGMFQGVGQPRLVSLVFPPLTASYVADRVVLAIERREVEVVLPGLVAWAMPLVALLPSCLRDLATEFVGGSTGMDSFAGYGHR